MPPGNCTELEIRSIPTVREGTLTYTVPLNGGVSVWLTKPISIPDWAETHYNWLPSVQELIELAEVRFSIKSNFCKELLGLLMCTKSCQPTQCYQCLASVKNLICE